MKSFRIKANPGSSEQYISFKLEQDFDTLEILSLKLSQSEIYSTFNSDFGVLCGRVIANGGIGIPNAKISVFIPLTEDDKLNSDILALYPYESTRDKDNEGRKYNLLPRVAQINETGSYSPKVPIGTFPTKEEVITNSTYLEVYKKYYKYSTVTNNSGDYMIYGVPVGVQTVHMSADITDIGKYSMTTGTMVKNLGYSENLFEDNGTKVRYSTDLDTLPNVDLQDVSVDVVPFWGDDNNFQIGITRQDFKIRALLVGTTTVFGNCFTDAAGGSRGDQFGSGEQAEDLWRITSPGGYNTHISSKRIGKMTATLLSLKTTIEDSDAGVPNLLNIYENGNFDTEKDYFVMDDTTYVSYINNGEFCFVIPCNRRKVITDENGNEVIVNNNDPNGIYTEFRGFFIFNLDNDSNLLITAGWNTKRVKMKVPQFSEEGNTFTRPDFNGTAIANNERWRKQHYKFQSNKYYAVSKFNGTTDRIDNPVNSIAGDPFWNVGVIILNTDPSIGTTNAITQFPSNGNASGGIPAFGAEWINFTLVFEQYGNGRGRGGAAEINSNVTNDYNTFYFVDENNTQLIGGTVKGTQMFLRSDRNKNTFVEVPKADILNIIRQTEIGASTKGFKNNDPPYDSDPLVGIDYKSNGSIQYFYKGIGEADCITLLKRLSLV